MRSFRSNRSFSVFLAVAVLILLPVGAQAWADDCSDLVVGRSYSTGFLGFTNLAVINPSFGVVPNAGAGRITFLPQGKASGKVTVAVGSLGLFKDMVYDDAEYNLSWDWTKKPVVCTGTLTAKLNYGPPLGTLQVHFQLIVSDMGQRVEMMHTDTGLMVAFTALPMRLFGCSNATIGGKYSFSANVWGLAPPGITPTLSGNIDAADSGAMQFRPYQRLPGGPGGSGSVEGWDTVSLSGNVISRILTGWYKVNHDCTGTVVVNDNIGNPTFHLQLFVLKKGVGVQVLNVDTVPVNGSDIPAFLYMLNLNRMDSK